MESRHRELDRSTQGTRLPRALLWLALSSAAALAQSPALADPPATPTGPTAPPLPRPSPPGAIPSASPSPPGAPAWSDRQTAAFAAGGIGVIGVGIGVIFGVMALSTQSEANGECAAGCAPGSQGQQDRANANVASTVAAGSFIAGGAFLAGAMTLWLTAPSRAPVRFTPIASARGLGVAVGGAF